MRSESKYNFSKSKALLLREKITKNIKTSALLTALQ